MEQQFKYTKKTLREYGVVHKLNVVDKIMFDSNLEIENLADVLSRHKIPGADIRQIKNNEYIVEDGKDGCE